MLSEEKQMPGTCSEELIDNTGLQKNFPKINVQYLVSFSSAEYEYESHFFSSRLDFPKKLWQRSKNQPDRLFLDFVYAEVKQQIQYFAYVKCFLRITFNPYVQFQA